MKKLNKTSKKRLSKIKKKGVKKMGEETKGKRAKSKKSPRASKKPKREKGEAQKPRGSKKNTYNVTIEENGQKVLSEKNLQFAGVLALRDEANKKYSTDEKRKGVKAYVEVVDKETKEVKRRLGLFSYAM